MESFVALNKMKVICAGFPKTGTKSLARALRILGYDKVYDFEEAIEYGYDECEEILLGKSTDINKVLDKVYPDDVEVVVDLPHSFFFEYYHRKWPKAKVILMIRNEDSQFKSYKNMMDEVKSTYWFTLCLPYILKSARRWKIWTDCMFSTVLGCIHPNELLWKQAYRKHNAYVKSVIPPENLLIWNISEGWAPICKYLNKPVPTEEFPYENKAGSDNRIAAKLMRDSRIVRDMKKEFLTNLLVFPIFICLLVWISSQIWL